MKSVRQTGKEMGGNPDLITGKNALLGDYADLLSDGTSRGRMITYSHNNGNQQSEREQIGTLHFSQNIRIHRLSSGKMKTSTNL